MNKKILNKLKNEQSKRHETWYNIQNTPLSKQTLNRKNKIFKQ